MKNGNHKRRTRGRWHAGCVLAAWALLLGSGAAAQEYSIVDMGTLGGPSSSAWGINSSGQVVGAAAVMDGNLHAFLWNGMLTDIGPLAGDLQAHAFDISDNGLTAVASFDLGEMPTHGLLWDGETTTDLGAFAPRGLTTDGAVFGTVQVTVVDTGIFERAAQWSGGVVTELGTLGGDFSFAAAANNLGQAVGMSLLAGNTGWHAAIYQGGQCLDLGTLGGANSQAYDINDARQVVGVSDTVAGQPHAFLFTVNAAGQVLSRTDLGTLDGLASYAYAVSETGVVVGSSGARAFRWQAGKMIDLNTLLPPDSGWVLEAAHGINANGWTVGRGLHDGQPRGFLLAAEVCAGDLTFDGLVGLPDWAVLAGNLGLTGTAEPSDGDLDGDADVDLRDAAAFQNAFGSGLPACPQ